jgi:hypothetical protein
LTEEASENQRSRSMACRYLPLCIYRPPDHQTTSYVNGLSPRRFRKVGLESSNKAVRSLAFSRRWMEPSATAYRHMSRHGFEPSLLIALADHLHHTFRSQHSLTLSQSKFYYLSKKAESICFGFQTFQPLTSKTRAINVSWFQHYRSHSFKSNGRGS